VFTACLQAVRPLQLLGIATFDGICDNSQMHKESLPHNLAWDREYQNLWSVGALRPPKQSKTHEYGSL
jgi:hypothetical protein